MPGPPAAARIGCVAALALAVTASVTACASKSPINRPGTSGSAAASLVDGVQQISLTTGDDYRFHPATFSVHPGTVRVIVHNTGRGAPHNFEVVGFPADFVPDADAGRTMEATFIAPPVQDGKPTAYRFECTIHVRQGQVGTMIVTPG